jgi:hypothetical protein
MGQEFRTGSNPSGYSLNAITLAFDGAIGIPTGFSLRVYDTASSGRPNHSLGLLSGNSNPSQRGNYVYSASGLTLQANSDYFLVLQGTGTVAFENDQYLWYSTTGGNGDSNDGWQVGLLWYSLNGGWSQWTGHSPGAFGIDASVVPEPCATAVLVAGCAVVCAGRAARSRRASRHPVGW